jgi:hypothetical protein
MTNNKGLITQHLKRSKHKSVVARRDISQEILVARHKFLVAPGRWAGDFASTALKSSWVRGCIKVTNITIRA